MKNGVKYIWIIFVLWVWALNVDAAGTGGKGKEPQQIGGGFAARVDSVMQQEEREMKVFHPKETIFEHLGDEYG